MLANAKYVRPGKPILLRCPSEIREAIKRAARLENRSMNNFLISLFLRSQEQANAQVPAEQSNPEEIDIDFTGPKNGQGRPR
jgi:uncharacterized protein (DUF1778 family)